MDGSYAEASAKKKKTAMAGLVKGLLIALTVFLLGFGTVLFGLFGIVFAGLSALACYFVFPYLNVEYEYVYCDGQIDFDKIFSGNKRKTALRIDFENVEMMAPLKSHALDSYNQQQVKCYDFSSGLPDAHIYALFVRKGEQLTKILFEPNEKMISLIKMKAPRKISEY